PTTYLSPLSLHDALPIAGHPLRVEPVERREEARALVQDDAPGEAGLEAVEHELCEQIAVAAQRDAPFRVVVSEHQRVVVARPAAPDHGEATANVMCEG